MAATGNKLLLGFMTVIRTERGALRGGYLLTSDYGRPIEFHYTSEVRLSGIQRFLHGADSDDYLYAESIGKPMTDRQTKPPKIIIVDCVQLLNLRPLIPAPVLFVSGEQATDETDTSSTEAYKPICHADFGQDLAAFEKIRELVSASFDWLEPFDRIKRALAEIRDPDARLAA